MNDFYYRVGTRHDKHANDTPKHVLLAVLPRLALAVERPDKLEHPKNKHEEADDKDEREERIDDDAGKFVRKSRHIIHTSDILNNLLTVCIAVARLVGT